MLLMIIGIIIWWAAHLMKRLAPDLRASMSARMGEGSKGVIALLLVLSVVLMVIGYRSADVIVLYSTPGWTFHLNNLLMLVAFFLVGVGSKGGWLGARMRHPMLTGFKVWAFAHLLVNGDLASVILFGSMLAWAVVSVIVINRSADGWTADRSVAFGRRDVILIAVWTLLFGLAAAIHIWLGYNPFGGGA